MALVPKSFQGAMLVSQLHRIHGCFAPWCGSPYSKLLRSQSAGVAHMINLMPFVQIDFEATDCLSLDRNVTPFWSALGCLPLKRQLKLHASALPTVSIVGSTSFRPNSTILLLLKRAELGMLQSKKLLSSNPSLLSCAANEYIVMVCNESTLEWGPLSA